MDVCGVRKREGVKPYFGTAYKNRRGEKLAGPALNPLKGSSTNLSHMPEEKQTVRQT